MGRLCILGFSDVCRGRTMYSKIRAVAGLVTAPCWRPLQLLEANRCVFGVKMAAMWDDDRMLRRELDAILGLYSTGALRPVIDRSFPLADAAMAHTHIHQGRNLGKVLLECLISVAECRNGPQGRAGPS